jgi:hypothetical protein
MSNLKKIIWQKKKIKKIQRIKRINQARIIRRVKKISRIKLRSKPKDDSDLLGTKSSGALSEQPKL